MQQRRTALVAITITKVIKMTTMTTTNKKTSMTKTTTSFIEKAVFIHDGH